MAVTNAYSVPKDAETVTVLLTAEFVTLAYFCILDLAELVARLEHSHSQELYVLPAAKHVELVQDHPTTACLALDP